MAKNSVTVDISLTQVPYTEYEWGTKECNGCEGERDVPHTVFDCIKELKRQIEKLKDWTHMEQD